MYLNHPCDVWVVHAPRANVTCKHDALRWFSEHLGHLYMHVFMYGYTFTPYCGRFLTGKSGVSWQGTPHTQIQRRAYIVSHMLLWTHTHTHKHTHTHTHTHMQTYTHVYLIAAALRQARVYFHNGKSHEDEKIRVHLCYTCGCEEYDNFEAFFVGFYALTENLRLYRSHVCMYVCVCVYIYTHIKYVLPV